MQFQKATKKRSKLRLALDGPSGSGKTYTALTAATAIASGGKIAVIDTERGSASLYSDKFDFDVLELETFDPRLYIEAIQAAEQAGYAVVVIDSLSHAWEGEGGALDQVDKAAKRAQGGNSFTAWKDVTPLQRRLVDAILGSPCHVIVTMRSKMDYVQEKDERSGKTVIRKVGMAPIQRQGMEYEFTIVADMDTDHNLMVSKSRCAPLADAVVNRPGVEWFGKLLEWLNSGDGESVPAKPVEAKPTFTAPAAPAPEPEPVQPATLNGAPVLPEKMTLSMAKTVTNSQGEYYWNIPSEALSYMYNTMNKIPAGKKTDEHHMKMDAIDVILAHRRAHPEDEPKAPAAAPKANGK